MRIELAVVALSMLAALSASSAQIRAGQNNQASQPITGVLVTAKVYGPPGYGETPKSDAKHIIYVLRTREHIRLSGDDASTSTQDFLAIKGYA